MEIASILSAASKGFPRGSHTLTNTSAHKRKHAPFSAYYPALLKHTTASNV